MRAALYLTLAAAVGLAGCRSERQQIDGFRQHFLGECVLGIRAQPATPKGLDADAVCNCVADKLFTGKAGAEIGRIVKEQTEVTKATTQCAAQQLRGRAASAEVGPAAAQAGGSL